MEREGLEKGEETSEGWYQISEKGMNDTMMKNEEEKRKGRTNEERKENVGIAGEGRSNEGRNCQEKKEVKGTCSWWSVAQCTRLLHEKSYGSQFMKHYYHNCLFSCPCPCPCPCQQR